MRLTTKCLRRLCDLVEPLAYKVTLAFITEVEEDEETGESTIILNTFPEAFDEEGNDVTTQVIDDLLLIKMSAIIEVESDLDCTTEIEEID